MLPVVAVAVAGAKDRMEIGLSLSLSLSLSPHLSAFCVSLFPRSFHLLRYYYCEGERGKVEKCKAFQMAQIVRHFFLFLLPSELHSPVDPSLPAHSVYTRTNILEFP